MVSRTAGDDCGKADGDYLDWESAEWVLKGKASFGEVTEEDLCRTETKIQVFAFLQFIVWDSRDSQYPKF